MELQAVAEDDFFFLLLFRFELLLSHSFIRANCFSIHRLGRTISLGIPLIRSLRISCFSIARCRSFGSVGTLISFSFSTTFLTCSDDLVVSEVSVKSAVVLLILLLWSSEKTLSIEVASAARQWPFLAESPAARNVYS